MCRSVNAMVHVVYGHGWYDLLWHGRWLARRCCGRSGRGRVSCDYVSDRRRRQAGASNEQRHLTAARTYALDRLAVRHLIGVVAVYLEDLVANLQAAVERRRTLLG